MSWRLPILLILAFLAPAAEPDQPVRIFACTHSFAVYVPEFLSETAKTAGVTGQRIVGISRLPGSHVIDHWNLPDDRNKAKQALMSGNIDVLTLTPIMAPDDGIRNFVRLANEHNPRIRIAMQESWGPFFTPLVFWMPREHQESSWWKSRNDATFAGLLEHSRKPLQELDDLATAINAEIGRPILNVIPAAQAVMALREQVRLKQVPGVVSQDSLFTDQLGHPGRIVRTLVGWCHFAVIHRRTPVGQPVPQWLKDRPEAGELNRLLQTIAWQAVTTHPLSGVTPPVQPPR